MEISIDKNIAPKVIGAQIEDAICMLQGILDPALKGAAKEVDERLDRDLLTMLADNIQSWADYFDLEG